MKKESIKFNCKNCGRSIKAKVTLAGRIAKCPDCQKKIKIPTTLAKKTVKFQKNKEVTSKLKKQKNSPPKANPKPKIQTVQKPKKKEIPPKEEMNDTQVGLDEFPPEALQETEFIDSSDGFEFEENSAGQTSIFESTQVNILSQKVKPSDVGGIEKELEAKLKELQEEDDLADTFIGLRDNPKSKKEKASKIRKKSLSQQAEKQKKAATYPTESPSAFDETYTGLPAQNFFDAAPKNFSPEDSLNNLPTLKELEQQKRKLKNYTPRKKKRKES